MKTMALVLRTHIHPDYTRVSILDSFYTPNPGTLLLGRRQTVQTHIRRHIAPIKTEIQVILIVKFLLLAEYTLDYCIGLRKGLG